MPTKDKKRHINPFWGPNIKAKGLSSFGFKPIKLNTSKNIKNASKRNLTWDQASIRYPRMQAFGDADRDGILNAWDCKPFDPLRHGDVPLYKQDATRLGGNAKNRLSSKQVKEQRRMLREAGYPSYVAVRVGSWHGPKVQQFIKGERALPSIYPNGEEEEYKKTIGDPQKVKEFFDRVGKDAPERIRQAVIHSQSQKNRYDQDSTKIRARSNKWKAEHKVEQKEYYEKFMEENRDRINKEKREKYDPEKRLEEFMKIPKEVRVAKAAEYYQKVREKRIQDNKDVNKIIKDAGDNSKNSSMSAQELINDSEDLNSSEDKD